MELFRNLTGGIGFYLVDWGEDSNPFINSATGARGENWCHAALDAARRVRQKKQARIDRVKLDEQTVQLFTVPMFDHAQTERCLSLAVTLETGQKKADLLGALQWFSLLFYGLEAEKGREEEKRATLRVAGFMESIGQAIQGDDFPEAAARIVESFRVQANCGRVALATVCFGKVRLKSISGVPGNETTRSEGATAIESLLREAVRRDEAFEGADEKQNLRLPELGALGVERFWCAPLHCGEKTVGAWLFLWDETPRDYDEIERFLRSASGLLGPQLRLIEKTRPGHFGGMLKRLWKRAGVKARTLVTAVVAALLILALYPAPLKVKAPFVLRPEVRRTVSAPFDGVLRRTMVEPGEAVQSGQLLAELDGREIRWRLAETVAQKQRAGKQEDTAMSEGRIADAQVARLEAESLEESAQVLQYRLKNIRINAPEKGRVLRGDLKHSEGATVRMGETLFEIGHLGTMSAEIEVREADIALVEAGAEVTLRFDSLPGEKRKVKLKTVAPASEYRDGFNVFVCLVTLDCPDEELRPGGLGQANIEGPLRPLIWRILRKPSNWILQRLP